MKSIAIAAALLFASPVLAHELKVGNLEIIHASIPQPAASAKSAGGYMAISNDGTESDQLIGIETDFAAKSELHESKVDANGIGTMEPVPALVIAPGETVNLEQGGYHIMFMGLKEALVEGEMRKATLIFEKAGRVEIEFMVDPPMGEGMDAMEGMDHSQMGEGAAND
ncbi:MAG: copper chaperone PCu(A)C [Acetobacteraceae bacterium]|nr:MAG: copper chaperone PCu(A)C [Acetobacteraceae bacterium]